jgi:hypothetical protein
MFLLIENIFAVRVRKHISNSCTSFVLYQFWCNIIPDSGVFFKNSILIAIFDLPIFFITNKLLALIDQKQGSCLTIA